MERYNWTRIALLTQDENIFKGVTWQMHTYTFNIYIICIHAQVESGIRFALEQANITVKSRTFQTESDPAKTVDLFVSFFICVLLLLLF